MSLSCIPVVPKGLTRSRRMGAPWKPVHGLHVHRVHVRTLSKCDEPNSAMDVNEPGLGSSAESKLEKGIDGSLERTGTLLHLGE